MGALQTIDQNIQNLGVVENFFDSFGKLPTGNEPGAHYLGELENHYENALQTNCLDRFNYYHPGACNFLQCDVYCPPVPPCEPICPPIPYCPVIPMCPTQPVCPVIPISPDCHGAVPEPSSMALMGIGMILAYLFKRSL